MLDAEFSKMQNLSYSPEFVPLIFNGNLNTSNVAARLTYCAVSIVITWIRITVINVSITDVSCPSWSTLTDAVTIMTLKYQNNNNNTY